MSNYQLVSFSPTHFYESIVIFNQEFGKDYISFEELDKQYKSNTFLGYGVVDNASKELIGLCLGYTNYTAEEQFKLPLPKEYVYLKSIVVRRDCHGKGIGKRLLAEFIKKADEVRQDIFSTVWVKEHTISVFEKMLAKSQFVLCSEHKNYWQERSMIEKFECEKCGSPPCTCTMRVYAKKIQ